MPDIHIHREHHLVVGTRPQRAVAPGQCQHRGVAAACRAQPHPLHAPLVPAVQAIGVSDPQRPVVALQDHPDIVAAQPVLAGEADRGNLRHAVQAVGAATPDQSLAVDEQGRAYRAGDIQAFVAVAGVAQQLAAGQAHPDRADTVAQDRLDAVARVQVLDDYDRTLLDELTGICAGGAIISYSLYTVSADTVAMHGTGNLIFTVPFVIYGVFRYLYLLHRRGGGGDPSAALLQDYHLLVAFCGWLASVLLLLR